MFLGNRLFYWVVVGLTLFSDFSFGALVLPKNPAQVVIDWSGIDEVDGAGAEIFSYRGETITATLRVLCNKKQGYNITFHSSNAYQADRSLLVSGSNQIDYRATMDTTGIQNANVIKSSLDLQNASNTSIEVDFFRGVIPMDGNTQANRIDFHLTLSSYGATIKLKPMGTYTDVITAIAALN